MSNPSQGKLAQASSSPKLLDRVRETLRRKHYSYRTEQAYAHWIKRFILFHNKRHPQEMGTPEIEAFLTHLAVHEHVAASTQNQALSAILFLYRHVLHIEIELPTNGSRITCGAQHCPLHAVVEQRSWTASPMSPRHQTRRKTTDAVADEVQVEVDCVAGDHKFDIINPPQP